jgi:hypothetical protein
MERWFLAGAIAGLLILLFDKPLANDITSQFIQQPFSPPVPPPDVIPPNLPAGSGCGCADTPTIGVAASLSPISTPGSPVAPGTPYTYAAPPVYNNLPTTLGGAHPGETLQYNPNGTINYAASGVTNPSVTIPDIPNAKPKPMPFKATPLSPSPVIIGPSNSQPVIGNRLHIQSSKSPAPKPALVDPDFKGFYYN